MTQNTDPAAPNTRSFDELLPLLQIRPRNGVSLSTEERAELKRGLSRLTAASAGKTLLRLTRDTLEEEALMPPFCNSCDAPLLDGTCVHCLSTAQKREAA